MNHDGNAASGSSSASRPVGSAVLGSVARSRLARPAAEHHSVDKVLGLGRDLLGGHELRHLLLLALGCTVLRPVVVTMADLQSLLASAGAFPAGVSSHRSDSIPRA